jgi:hypothetical protein
MTRNERWTRNSEGITEGHKESIVAGVQASETGQLHDAVVQANDVKRGIVKEEQSGSNHETVTLKQWKANLKPGMKLKCVFRWYWNKATEFPENFKPAPPDGEMCEMIEVRATQAIMKTPTVARSFMYYPRASELKATETGFELYFRTDAKLGERSGQLMSRYEYVTP